VELTYSTGFLARRVGRSGQVKIRDARIGVSLALAGYDVGLESVAERRYAVWFGRLCLGEIDLETESFRTVCG
jgi:hypothetical protein